MRRVATILGVAAAVLLLLPWRICDCSEDGVHLKVLWGGSSCEHATVGPSDDSHEETDGSDDAPHEDCRELFTFSGSQAGPAVALPDLLPSHAQTLGPPPGAALDADSAPRSQGALASHGPPPVPPSPLALGTRLLL